MHSNPEIPEGYCRSKLCEDQFSQGLCLGSANCSWDAFSDVCYSGDHVPCVRRYEEDTCDSAFCDWNAQYDVCLEKGASPDCDVRGGGPWGVAPLPLALTGPFIHRAM